MMPQNDRQQLVQMIRERSNTTNDATKTPKTVLMDLMAALVHYKETSVLASVDDWMTHRAQALACGDFVGLNAVLIMGMLTAGQREGAIDTLVGYFAVELGRIDRDRQAFGELLDTVSEELALHSKGDWRAAFPQLRPVVTGEVTR